MKNIHTTLAVSAILLFIGCGKNVNDFPGYSTTNTITELPSGLKYIDTEVGTGSTAAKGHKLSVHYTGYLISGKKFDSSLDRNEAFEFQLGMGQVIKGWEEGLSDMKVGGKRKLIIPSNLAYGSRSIGDIIPANSTLVFDVELIKISE
ncbi:MAG: FKBP-type peptidyl-prolyl cis-trans isomerase [Ignavibacteria bacterium]|nr:FKBP-type peptidyl-prolyl cis-trans isomerase [Ignavibacteria bacterium]